MLLAAAALVAGHAQAQSALIGDVMASGGMPIPGGPLSSGISVYADGHVVTYKNYSGRSVVTTVAYLTSQQVDKLLRTGAGLTPVDLVRDASQPQCADAPYVQIAIANAAGQLVKVQDQMNCVTGNRPDYAGLDAAQFLTSLESVALFGT
jgi:hypothetical protein